MLVQKFLISAPRSATLLVAESAIRKVSTRHISNPALGAL